MSTNGDICVQNGVRIPSSELVIKACRASGAGGQHVNKTSTKVQITWHLLSSFALDDEQKQRLTERLRNRINKAGFITCSVDETRSQSKNIELAKERLAEMIKKALFVDVGRSLDTSWDHLGKSTKIEPKLPTSSDRFLGPF